LKKKQIRCPRCFKNLPTLEEAEVHECICKTFVAHYTLNNEPVIIGIRKARNES